MFAFQSISSHHICIIVCIYLHAVFWFNFEAVLLLSVLAVGSDTLMSAGGFIRQESELFVNQHCLGSILLSLSKHYKVTILLIILFFSEAAFNLTGPIYNGLSFYNGNPAYSQRNK